MSKNKADKSLDEQAFEALEDALALDDNDLSNDELEAKVSAAAKDLADAQTDDSKAKVSESSKSDTKQDKPARSTPPYTPAVRVGDVR